MPLLLAPHNDLLNRKWPHLLSKIFILFFFASILGCASQGPQKNQYHQVSLPPEKSRFQYEAVGSKFMVSTQGLASTQAGIEMLSQGGNIFDAFAAVSFTQAVERPHSTGIGGGGFALFYVAQEDKVYALDFREVAPARAHSKMFLKKDGSANSEISVTGGLAVATPGFVKGVLQIHKKYGKLSLAQVMAPSIRLAEEGVPVYPALHKATLAEKERLSRYSSSRQIFLNPEGEPWPLGHRLIQKDLAQTLQRIARTGASAFDSGFVADRIVSSVQKAHGILQKSDLKKYQPKWRNPVQGDYKEFTVVSYPPPSSGGTHVIQILNSVEKSDLKTWGPQHPQSIHLTAASMLHAFYDRARFMGDPDFVKVPVEKLTSQEYADQIRASISTHHAKKSQDLPSNEESPDTIHFSIMDSEGNAIASTQTINGWFGSALVAEGTGVMLNNEMDDFAAQVGASNLYGAIGGAGNLVQPFKRPLSSMSPTLVLQKGKPVMVLGSPSGTRIITCVALTLLNSLEYQLPLWDSVTLTRYHHQWQPDQLMVEPSTFPNATMKHLESIGYIVKEKDLGCRIQAIQKVGEQLIGVSDPREEGASQGL